MSLRTGPLGRTLLLGSLVGASWGLCELAAGPFGADRSVAAAVLATAAGYGVLGGLVAVLRPPAGRRTRPRPDEASRATVAWCLAGLAFLLVATALEGGAHSTRARLFAMAVAAATAVAVHGIARRLLHRAPKLASTALWSVLPVLALVLALGGWVRSLLAAAEPSRAASGSAPSVLLVTIDTLRADYLGAYGHPWARTPVIDGLASRGVLFEQAIAPSYVTGPSHVSILSGQLPSSHGVTENSQRIDDALVTVPELLRLVGFRTAGFVSGYPVTDESLGIGARFEVFDDDLRSLRLIPESVYATSLGRAVVRLLESRGFEVSPYDRSAARLTAAAVGWLRAEETTPFFLWAHYYDPHLPYAAPRRLLSPEVADYHGPATGDWYLAPAERREAIVRSEEAMAQMKRLYEAEVSFVDEQLGLLVEAARQRAGSEGLWIVVTADHGESFGEHGIYYWRDLYDESLRVPLVVVPPRTLEAGRRIPGQVRLIDLAPTLYELAGLRRAPPSDGSSLMPQITGETGDGSGPAIGVQVPSTLHPYGRVSWSVRADGWKAILRAEGWLPNRDHAWAAETRELYDLRADPGEIDNVESEAGERFRRLVSELEGITLARGEAITPTARQLRMLRSLGYVE